MARPKVADKPYEKNWTLRQTPERIARMERLRQMLKDSGRDLETIYDTVTTAAILDEALAALERELDH